MRTFRSDNNAAMCSEALAAMQAAGQGGHQIGYGDDPATVAAVAVFRRLFGEETAVFFVATGTAANVLAIASLAEPWQHVLCHRHSHLADDESTAPERITHCRTITRATDRSRLTVADIEAMAADTRGDVHQTSPGVITISNPTEFGTLYRPDELRTLCGVAHEHGYRVHVDGARFANAVARLGCDPAALSADAGVDAMSFGGTKNGLAFGEAVLFFPQRDGAVHRRAVEAFPHHRKSTGHLLSKHRFVAAPFAATLADDAWLRHAAHANAMATRLGDGLRTRGLPPAFPVEANGVFVPLPDAVDRTLQARGHEYYPFGDAAHRVTRLMCSFDTTPEDVDGLLADVEAALADVR